MAHGLPDYSRGVDIEAQSIATLAIDIAAQTLSELNVDIVAQTLGNMSVDIVAQSLANLNVDLVAQTLAQINIDIIAQTIGNLTIDIAAQNLAEIINRPKYGAAQRVVGSITATASTKVSLGSVSGKGMIYGGFIAAYDTQTQALGLVYIEIDGVVFAAWTFNSINGWKLYEEHSYPFYMLQYDDSGFFYTVGISRGLTFETSFEIFYEEQYGRTPAVHFQVNYAVI